MNMSGDEEEGCPINIDEFYRNYEGNDDKLVDMMLRYKLIKKETICPKCEHKIKLTMKKNGALHFRCRKTITVNRKKEICEFYLSARKGTFFENAVTNFGKLIQFFVYWCFLPHPHTAIMRRIFDFSHKAIVEWSGLCRDVCITFMRSQSQKLGGIDKIVDVDINETEVKSSLWMLGMTERGSRKVFVVPISETSQIEDLAQILEEYILPGTTIISASWEGLRSHPHLELREPLHHVPPDGDHHKTNMERLWKACYRGIPAFGRGKNTSLNSYLSEFMFKHRFDLNIRVDVFLKAVALAYPPKY